MIVKNILKYMRLGMLRLVIPVLAAHWFAIPPEDITLTQALSAPKLRAENIHSQKVIQAFEKVAKRFNTLHNYEITLVSGEIRESTMQAQPIVNARNVFDGVKKYQIKINEFVRDSDTRLEDLSEDILMGWFAHEMGHLVDYQPHSNFEMIEYGIKYLWFDDFKKKVEHAADEIAVMHGFKKELLASKKFLFESKFNNSSYQEKLRKFYLPIEDIEQLEDDTAPHDQAAF